MPVKPFPVDILEEIFEWLCVDRRVPSRNLALVCKQWRQILLHLPILWRTMLIDANECHQSLEIVHNRLKRRLHHARNIALDVVLSNSSTSTRSKTPKQPLDLFTMMAELAPVERWYSLAIVDRYSDMELKWPRPDEIPIKSFRSLRVLSIDALLHTYLSTGSRLDFLTRIAQCKPQLYNLRIMGEVPPQLAPLFQQPTLVTFEADSEAFDMLPDASFPKLREVTIDGKHWVTNAEQLQKIPSLARLKILNCSPWLVSAFRMLNIETLHLAGFTGWDNMLGMHDMMLRLPNLRTLSMWPCLPHHLQIFEARDTQSVRLSGVYAYLRGYPEEERKKTEALTLSLFTDVRHLNIYPTSLAIGTEGITDRTLVVMLEAWPQLQHLSITLAGTFDLYGILTRRLQDEKNPPCPQLETMHLEVQWFAKGKKWRRWRRVAEEIMARRKGYPLKSIIWRNTWFSVESVTCDMILIN